MEASALSAPAGLSRDASALARTSPWLRVRSDEQLVNLFRSGSEDAFRAIHDRYRQRLFGYARQMLGGSGSDAEDVMQDVFLRAYRALRVDARPVSLRAWLYRVAHNRCIDHLRRPAPAPSEIFEMSRTPEHDPFDAAERREDLQRLVEDVRRLPEQQRSALLMREMDGMSYADLAAALETSVPAVKSLLVRARIGLVEAIEARDTDCADIRHDLAASYDRGVRASGRARRHLRDCEGCTTYRAQLRGIRQSFAALNPGVAAPGLLAKLLGLGSASGGAGAAAGTAGGTSVVVGGGAAAAVSVSKVAAVVCCAAALTGGAVEVKRIVTPEPSRTAAQDARVAGAAAAAPVVHAVAAAMHSVAGVAPELRRSAVATDPADDVALHPPIPMGPSLTGLRDNGNGSGGTAAPDDPTSSATPTPTAQPATETEDDESILPIADDVLPLGGDDADEEATTSESTDGSTTSSGSSGSTTGTTSGGTSSPGGTTSGSSTSGSQTTGSGGSSTSTGSSQTPTGSTSPGARS
ncbi:MAG: RNA polymerase sigma factor [Solirubrobacteraceae bacterium]